MSMIRRTANYGVEFGFLEHLAEVAELFGARKILGGSLKAGVVHIAQGYDVFIFHAVEIACPASSHAHYADVELGIGTKHAARIRKSQRGGSALDEGATFQGFHLISRM